MYWLIKSRHEDQESNINSDDPEIGAIIHTMCKLATVTLWSLVEKYETVHTMYDSKQQKLFQENFDKIKIKFVEETFGE